MIGTHRAFIALLCRAALQAQSAAEPDMLMGRAIRLSRLFIEQADALARLKGNTRQQKVTVEHVHVHEGGQAIVGEVSTAGQQRLEDETRESRKKLG